MARKKEVLSERPTLCGTQRRPHGLLHFPAPGSPLPRQDRRRPPPPPPSFCPYRTVSIRGRSRRSERAPQLRRPMIYRTVSVTARPHAPTVSSTARCPPPTFSAEDRPRRPRRRPRIRPSLYQSLPPPPPPPPPSYPSGELRIPVVDGTPAAVADATAARERRGRRGCSAGDRRRPRSGSGAKASDLAE